MLFHTPILLNMRATPGGMNLKELVISLQSLLSLATISFVDMSR